MLALLAEIDDIVRDTNAALRPPPGGKFTDRNFIRFYVAGVVFMTMYEHYFARIPPPLFERIAMVALSVVGAGRYR